MNYLQERLLKSRLLKPFDYLRVKVVEKYKYDYVYPIVIGSISTLFFFYYPKPLQIFGQNGIISLIIGIVQMLTGFYIASLAAVATFKKKGMDDHMKGQTAELKIMKKGVCDIETLSRRRFLCLLFGYLAFISIVVYFTGGLANIVAPTVSNFISIKLRMIVKWGFLWFYLVVTANLLVTTLLGLFYMIDRIHRE